MNKYAITLNTEILNQHATPTKSIVATTDTVPQYNDGFYSVGDVLVRSELVLAIVKMTETTHTVTPVEILHG